ncbi:hypothetical protein ABFA07_014964 [Porites harrisoni]
MAAKTDITVVSLVVMVFTASMVAVQAIPRPNLDSTAVCVSCCHSQWKACMSQCQPISSCIDCSMAYSNCTLECPGSCQI